MKQAPHLSQSTANTEVHFHLEYVVVSFQSNCEMHHFASSPVVQNLICCVWNIIGTHTICSLIGIISITLETPQCSGKKHYFFQKIWSVLSNKPESKQKETRSPPWKVQQRFYVFVVCWAVTQVSDAVCVSVFVSCLTLKISHSSLWLCFCEELLTLPLGRWPCLTKHS